MIRDYNIRKVITWFDIYHMSTRFGKVLFTMVARLDWAVINFPLVLVNILKPHPGMDRGDHVDKRSSRFSDQSS